MTYKQSNHLRPGDCSRIQWISCCITLYRALLFYYEQRPPKNSTHGAIIIFICLSDNYEYMLDKRILWILFMIPDDPCEKIPLRVFCSHEFYPQKPTNISSFICRHSALTHNKPNKSTLFLCVHKVIQFFCG